MQIATVQFVPAKPVPAEQQPIKMAAVDAVADIKNRSSWGGFIYYTKTKNIQTRNKTKR